MKGRLFPRIRLALLIAAAGLLPATGCLPSDFWTSAWEGVVRSAVNTAANNLVIEPLDTALNQAE